MSILACRNLTKSYGRSPHVETALDDVSLTFNPGETCVLLGPSGSGKTTLLSILGCLLTPTGGELWIDGCRVDYRRHSALVTLRRQRIGFVFQHAQLLPFLTVSDNLQVVARNAGLSRVEVAERTRTMTDRLGMSAYLRRYPGELSGGQRQRVAIARALLHRPAIVLADEPTAALDWENGRAAMALLLEQAKAQQAVVLAVTHDHRLAGMFDRVLEMNSGRLG